MTKNISFHLITCLLFICAACSGGSGGEEDAVYNIYVSKSLLSFPYEGGSLDLQVTATCGNKDASWTANASNANFVVMEPTSGTGSTKVKIVAEKNEDGSNKTGTIVFKCGTESHVVEVTQAANLVKECYAEPVDVLAMSNGIACGVKIGNSCHNYYIALYEASIFRNLQDNEIEEEIKKQSAKKQYPDYPQKTDDNRFGTDYQDIVAWFKDVKPGTNYVIVTSSYTKEGIHGEIKMQEVSTFSDNYQPMVDVSDFSDTQVGGKDFYQWKFTMNPYCGSYFAYVCASSYEFPSYKSDYSDVVLAWKIHKEIPNVPSDERYATKINTVEGASPSREYIFPKLLSGDMFTNMEKDVNDKYLQVVTWGLTADSQLSGKITVKRIEISKSELSVITNEATDIYSTSATLNGGIIGAEGSIEVGFEYGVSSSSLIMTTDSKMIANGSFSIDIKGLTSNTTYYYRAYAKQNGKKIYGSIKQFTTLTDWLNKEPFDNDIKL